jgi:hypothetical protein
LFQFPAGRIFSFRTAKGSAFGVIYRRRRDCSSSENREHLKSIWNNEKGKKERSTVERAFDELGDQVLDETLFPLPDSLSKQTADMIHAHIVTH